TARWSVAPMPDARRLAGDRTWWSALAASVAAWVLPGLGLWALAGSWRFAYGPLRAAYDYAAASSAAGLMMAPGGILVTGARLLSLGFDVAGIDESAAQVHMAASRAAQPDVVQRGSVLQIPAADASFDFVYIINVLHHLNSVDEQRRAFAELFRVLRPGGLL